MAEKKSFGDLRELGNSGLNQQGGYIYEDLEPEFQGDRWRKTIRKMENDPIVGAMLFTIEMLIRRVLWRIAPADDKPESIKVAEFVQSCLDDMTPSWHETLGEVLTMLPYGWSFHEIVYKRRLGQEPEINREDPSLPPDYVPPPSAHNDKKIGWHRWGGRAQNTLFHWEFDSKGDVLGMVQVSPPDYLPVFIPMEKAMLFRTTVRFNNPEGRSILKSAYQPWYYRTHLQRVEAIGVERDMNGVPIAWVPPEILSSGANAEQTAIYDRIKQIVTSVRKDEQDGIIWPLAYDDNGNKIFDFQLLSTGGTRLFNTEAIIGRYDQRITMSVLADFILVGHESVGAYSLSADKSDLFFTAIEAWLDTIASVVNQTAIPALLRLNGYKVEVPPMLVHGEIRKISLAELGDFVSKIAGAGAMLPDTELENYFRQQANMPLIPDGEKREYVAPINLGSQPGLDSTGDVKGNAKTSSILQSKGKKKKTTKPTANVSGENTPGTADKALRTSELAASLMAAAKHFSNGG